MTASARKQAPRDARTPSARALAYSILFAVESRAAYASELLHIRLETIGDPREAALATELVMGALRRQRLLDFFVERYSGRKVSKLDIEVLIALRLGIYQLRYLKRIPARAAVNESVQLVRSSRKKSASSFVNAVLRRAASESDRPVEEFLSTEITPEDALGIIHSHPTWLVERWLRKFGKPGTVALLESNNRPPANACVFLNAEHREKTLQSLTKAGLGFEPGRLVRDAIIVQSGNIAKSEAFRNGWVGIQDEASQMIPLLLGVRAGDFVLDLCAPPGGKTMRLANLAGEHGRVVASDLHESRLQAMSERLNKSNVANVSLVALDGTASLPLTKGFNRILVDAPCSGTGTLSRNPEIRWRLKPEDLADLHRCQVALVLSALEYLSPGGTLLYSTCSLESEENESVIQEALRDRRDICQEPVEVPQEALAATTSASELIGDDGTFGTFPPLSHTDGFFAALLKRR
ncbi:MAG TPA: 16S rRNA (cytosine(967)-C(5))-methyltransferase RsmB [Candidatus Acidoferrales bacterium]|nr:16S rRNA (cytosine(967)-C(5))-methyltransferase RsmB [Candidatus Acidoferrales bacterium]